MACNQGTLDVFPGGAESASAPPSDTDSISSPILIVSNSPESVNHESGTKTLYKCEIALGSGTTRIRIFFWHKATGTGDTYFHVLASLASGSGTISDRRIEAGVGTVAEGVCIAKTHLYGTWPTASSNVSISTTEATIWSGSAGNEVVRGMVMEFDVELSSAATFRIRTTAWNASGVQGSWSDTPVLKTVDTHPRGWWPYSWIAMDCGDFDAKPPVGQHLKRITVCENNNSQENGTNGFAYQGQELDYYGKHNLGCYGANLSYSVTLKNTGSQAYPVYAYVNVRGTGDAYIGGAFHLRLPSGYPECGINYLMEDENKHYCRLTCDACHNGDQTPISVPANTAAADFVVDLAIAGGTGLPFNLLLSGIAVQPVEDPP